MLIGKVVMSKVATVHICSLMNEVVHTSPTIGSNVEEVVWKNVHFIMWDIGGQESLRATWNTYFNNTKVSAVAVCKRCILKYCVILCIV